MQLLYVSDSLPRDIVFTWESVTATYIYNSINTVLDTSITDLMVRTNIVEQQLSTQGQSSSSRTLLSLLEVQFDVLVEYRPLKQVALDVLQVLEWVDATFDTDAKRQDYINTLKSTDDISFGSLERINLVMDSSAPAKEPIKASSTTTTTRRTSTLPLLIVATIGGVIVVMGIVLWLCRKRRVPSSTVKCKVKDAIEEEIEIPRTVLVRPIDFERGILVAKREDDVSMLAYPAMEMMYPEFEVQSASISNAHDSTRTNPNLRTGRSQMTSDGDTNPACVPLSLSSVFSRFDFGKLGDSVYNCCNCEVVNHYDTPVPE
jgi:hypothetical protein